MGGGRGVRTKKGRREEVQFAQLMSVAGVGKMGSRDATEKGMADDSPGVSVDHATHNT